MSEDNVKDEEQGTGAVVSDDTPSRSFVPDFPSRRVIAFFIDFKIILAGPFFMLTYGETVSPFALTIAPFAHWLGLAWFYLYMLFIVASGGRSIGMRVCRLKTVNRKGEVAGSFRTIVRWTLLLLMVMSWGSMHSSQLILSGLLSMMLFINLGLLMGRNGSGQLLHDGMAGVHVVDVDEKYAYPLQANSLSVLFVVAILLIAPLTFMDYFLGTGFASFNMDSERIEERLLEDRRVTSAWVFDHNEGALDLNVGCYLMKDDEYIQLQLDMVSRALEYYRQEKPDELAELKFITVDIEPSLNFIIYNDRFLTLDAPKDRSGTLEEWQDILGRTLEPSL